MQISLRKGAILGVDMAWTLVTNGENAVSAVPAARPVPKLLCDFSFGRFLAVLSSSGGEFVPASYRPHRDNGRRTVEEIVLCPPRPRHIARTCFSNISGYQRCVAPPGISCEHLIGGAIYRPRINTSAFITARRSRSMYVTISK